jgi:hypothetical protein
MTELLSFKDECSRATLPILAVVNREFPTLTTTFHSREYRELAKSTDFALQSYAAKRPQEPPV